MYRDQGLFHLVDGFDGFLRRFSAMLATRESKIKTYKDQFTQTLLRNTYNISHDFQILARCYRHEFETGKLDDISAAEILARNVMEIYTVFFYLFVEPQDSDTKAIRWHAYQIYGKKHALKMTDPWVRPKDDDRNSIKELQDWIKGNPLFNKLDASLQKRALDPPNSTLKPLGKIAESYGIPAKLFDFHYSSFSNTVHSNFLYLISSGDPKMEPINIRLKKTFVWNSLFTNMAIIDLLKMNPELETHWEPRAKKALIDHISEMKGYLGKLKNHTVSTPEEKT